MSDAVKAIRQNVDQEAADELWRGQAHDLLAAVIFDAIIFPPEDNCVGIGADQAMVRDGDAVGVAAQIGQHSLGTAKGRFGIDHPVGFAERSEPGREGIWPRQMI